MRKIILLPLLVILLGFQTGQAAQVDSLKRPCQLKTFIAPAALIGTGVLLFGHESQELEATVRKDFPLFSSHLDDYSQYVPFTAAMLSGTFGLKTQNNFKGRAIYAAMSYGAMAITVNILKKTVKELRPDGSDYNSFPSGHTATAFTGAELFHQELKYSHPLLSYAGYPIAAGVGTFRMLNNKHYLSDVLVGAGIGMLSAKLAYSIYHPKQSNKPEKFSLNFSPAKVMGKNGFALTSNF